MRKVEWQHNLDKLKDALEEYVQCMKPYHDKEYIKIEINTIVDGALNITGSNNV